MITFLLLTWLALSNIGNSHVETPQPPEIISFQSIPNLNDTTSYFKDKQSFSQNFFTDLEKVYLQFDRTFFEPGDAIWFSAFIRNANNLSPSEISNILHIEMIAPNGNTQKKYKLITKNGQAAGDFLIDQNAPGGLYKIRAYTNWQQNFGQFFEREIQVQRSVLPNLRMKLEFERKAYGASDEVVGKLELKDLENSPLKDFEFSASASLDGQQFTTLNSKTDDSGKAKVKFNLPEDLTTNDGLLNIKIQYKGQTESIARSIPIVLNEIDLQFFPEGGNLISGFSQKIAFKAIDEFGKPADIQGVILNSNEFPIGQFKSYHDGMGAFEFKPEQGEKYIAKITKPENIKGSYPLPKSLRKGHFLRVEENENGALKIRVSSNENAINYLVGRMGDRVLFEKQLSLQSTSQDTYLSNTIKHHSKGFGIAQIMLLNEEKMPVSERLVFLNPHKKLNVHISTNKEEYNPREKVKMTIKVTNDNGKPVSGQFALGVTDDKLLSFADDKQGNVLSHILLESELKGEIHEPNFYFDDPKDHPEKDQILALDYLMLTQGWRRHDIEKKLEQSLANFQYEPEKLAIKGVVLNAFSKPVKGALVNYEGVKMLTDKNGYFEFETLFELAYPRYLEISKDAQFHTTYKVTTALKEHRIALPNLIEQGSFSLVQSKNNFNRTSLSGILLDDSSEEPLIFASLSIFKNGLAITGCETDFDGRFYLQDLPKGKYEIHASYLGYQTLKMPNIELKKGVDNQLNIRLGADIQDLNEIQVTGYKVPLIEKDNTTQGSTLTAELMPLKKRKKVRKDRVRKRDKLALKKETLPKSKTNTLTSQQIRNLPTKSINALAATTSGAVVINDSEALNIRGARTNGTEYYLDGIRVSGRMVPQQNIEEIQVVRTGIPAEFENDFGIAEEPEFINQEVEEEVFLERRHEKILAAPAPPPPPPPAVPAQEIFKVVEQMPYFPGCEHLTNYRDRINCANDRLLEFVYEHLEYPELAKENGNEGVVVVRFVVEKDGDISNPEIVRDIGAQCGQEALRVVKKMPKWNPGSQRGRPVKVQYNLPIRFDLDGKGIVIDQKNRHFASKKGQILPSGLYIPNEFYQPKYDSKENIEREDFRETIYWNPNLNIPESGERTVEFFNSDDITTFRATVEGFGTYGNVGRGTTTYFVKQPFSMNVKVPPNFLTGDILQVPLTLSNNMNRMVNGELTFNIPANLSALEDLPTDQVLNPNESKTIYLPFKVNEKIGKGELHISFDSKWASDAFAQTIQVSPRGFPKEEVYSGNSIKEVFNVNISNPIEGSLRAKFSAHPTILGDLMSGLDRMLRQPNGCFEQTSSSNYPNILVLDYLKSSESLNKEIEKRALNFLEQGYNRLKTFEVKGGGFDWYGRAPAHEGLTAYGLMQFEDMKSVYSVENELIQRTAKWLLSRRDGKGGWEKNSRHLHSWGMQNGLSDAYIVYALCEAGFKNQLQLEIEKSYQDALDSDDPYMIALMANAIGSVLNIRGSKSNILVQKLLNAQNPDGSWNGKSTSITNSRGQGLIIETTALAVLALMKMEIITPEVRRAIEFIAKSKSQYGFGNTQSTVLAMKALVKYAKLNKVIVSDGDVSLTINGKIVAKESFEAGQQNSVVLDNLESYFRNGENVVTVQFYEIENGLPYDLHIQYSSLQPKNSEDCPLILETSLLSNHAKPGDNIRLTTIIKNNSKASVPNPIAVVGIPAGLSVQPWQLKELQEKEVFDFYEIMDNGYVVFHYRSLEAKIEKTIHLDLKAELPGEFEAPASQAYLYYGSEYKVWSKPERIVID